MDGPEVVVIQRVATLVGKKPEKRHWDGAHDNFASETNLAGEVESTSKLNLDKLSQDEIAKGETKRRTLE